MGGSCLEGDNGMNVQQAVMEVLGRANKPMPVKEIAAQIIADGLWKTEGKSPAATGSARIYADIRARGDQSPFIKVAPGTFGLRFASQGCAEPLHQYNGQVVKSEEIPGYGAPSDGKPMTFTDAAVSVLTHYTDREPTHYREISETAMRHGWLATTGKTPAATMYAQIITDIKRRQKRGEPPRFVQHGRGYVGLSQWMGRGLNFLIAQHNQQVRKLLKKRLLSMSPAAFEELVSQLLAEMGFESVEVTKISGDGGIDVRGTLVVGDVISIQMAVQVKKWKRNIQAPVVQQVRGSLGAHEQGLIITTSDFSPGAVKEAAQPDKTPIALMNGTQLVLLLMENGLGVRRTIPDLFEIDEELI